VPRLSIRLLGGFFVDFDGVPVIDFKSDKVRALLAFLAVEADRPHPRDTLAALLWPDSLNQVARTNLRGTLANLRKVIDDPHASPPYLHINRETIQFNQTSDHWLDVSALVPSSTETSFDPAQLERFEGFIALYRGPFLRGFSVRDSAPFEEWVVIKREQISRKVMVALCSLAAYYEQRGKYDNAQTYAWKLVELEPWNEEAHRQLMRLLALGGQRSAALTQYQACRKALANELNVDPSQETTALYEAIRNEDLASFLPALLSPISLIPVTIMDGGRLPFVGRQAELDELNGYLEKTLAGHGQAVFITGSPGSGKTALIGEFVHRTMQTHAGLIPAMGTCNVYTGIGDPYLPFLEIIELLTGDIGGKRSGWPISNQFARRLRALLPAVIQTLVDVGPDLINRMVPGTNLVERVMVATRSRGVWLDKLKALVEKQNTIQEGENIQQTDLFEQYTRVLLALARLHPLILVVDNLQWADIGSISLLYHLCQRTRDSRILFVGAYRQEEVSLGRGGERHPLEPILSEFKLDFGQILVNLDQCEGREFVEAYLDSEPNRLSSAFCETLFRHTAGHPLFTIELIRSLQDRGDLIQDEAGCWMEGKMLSWDKMPARVEAVIAERMGRLPQELHRILEVASVEGEEFTAEVVADVLAVDEGILVQQLSEQLDRKHRLVVAGRPRRLDGQRVSRYRFRHHLFQTYLYGSLDNIERAYLHEGVGGTLEKFYQEHPEEMNTNLVKLARHFQEAGMFQKAVDYLRLSGEKAERLSASEEAINHFRNALVLCAKMPDTLERDQTELGLTMALGAQLVATRGYSSTQVGQFYTRARWLCQKLSECLGDSPRTATKLIPVLLGLGAFYGHQAQFQSAREIYDQAFALAGASGDSEAMMLAYWGSAYLLLHMGEFISARSHLENALEAYEPQKHQRLITVFTLDMGVSCLSWLSWTLFFLGYPDQALERSSEAIALARHISHPFSLAVALATASCLHSYALDWDGTRELAEEAIEICHQKGFTFWFSVASTFRGMALAWQGEYDEGISQMREGERIWRTSGAIIGLPEYLIYLAEILGNAGQVEQGFDVLEKALEMIIKSGETICEAELHRIMGDLFLRLSNENQTKAESCFREAIEIARKQQAKMLELRATIYLSNLLLKQGMRDEARVILTNIYGWFNEGFHTQDFKSASNLLKELS
jgi:DNA-binding SARP family transcriptional activator/predicted ATPase